MATRRHVQRSTRRWHPALPSVLALLACFAILGAALGGVFKVRSVQVVGQNLPENRIVAAANVTGQNIFTVRSDQVVARLSAVREIVVTRVDTEFPDRVTIHAQIRPSLVAWQTPSGLFVLDMDGRVIDRVPRTSLPIIVGSDAHGALGSGIVQAVRYAVQTLPGAPGGAVSTFRYDPRSGLTIAGRSGWNATVGTGSPDTLVRRIADLVALLQTLKSRPQHLLSVDLRYRTPFARFAPR
ncbi:MAG TPA: cell division protein FtsQ/DivIB [Chloroflexota bacterium]